MCAPCPYGLPPGFIVGGFHILEEFLPIHARARKKFARLGGRLGDDFPPDSKAAGRRQDAGKRRAQPVAEKGKLAFCSALRVDLAGYPRGVLRSWAAGQNPGLSNREAVGVTVGCFLCRMSVDVRPLLSVAAQRARSGRGNAAGRQSPHEPCYIGRVLEFLPHPKFPAELQVRVAWFYRPKDVLSGRRKHWDPRLVVATMHTDLNPVTSIRGLCTVKHEAYIPDLEAYKKSEDHFYYNQLFDRYCRAAYDVVLCEKVRNLPADVAQALRERFEFILVEEGRAGEFTEEYQVRERKSIGPKRYPCLLPLILQQGLPALRSVCSQLPHELPGPAAHAETAERLLVGLRHLLAQPERGAG
ncbi:MAG: hypothetical protein BJ554DRAFT_6 [Olpidium bornovanus]|uniref:BAH domain-containing protein n=1 Tax=Olpidium bornovanus TaxID=278681 RepID=A0A8H8DIF4_9FUNG|nr:MAG: hypothetical protein BJ554DRAFT_6 [Olpidium bornovanus]